MEPKTAASDCCDNLYSEVKEAKACYAYGVSITSCPAHIITSIARGYINEFNQPLETVKVGKAPKKTCSNDEIPCGAD